MATDTRKRAKQLLAFIRFPNVFIPRLTNHFTSGRPSDYHDQHAYSPTVSVTTHPSTPTTTAATVAQTALKLLEAHMRSALGLPSPSPLAQLSDSSMSPLPCTVSPSKLAQVIKKHWRPTRAEKEFFRTLLPPYHRRSLARASKRHKAEWEAMLEEFEVSKYFIVGASPWDTFMLVYHDAAQRTLFSAPPSGQTSKESKRLSKSESDVRIGDEELLVAAQLVMEMNQLWRLAQYDKSSSPTIILRSSQLPQSAPQQEFKQGSSATIPIVDRDMLLAFILSDLMLKQICYELCLSGTLTQLLNEASLQK
jgi:hypothetical protein